MNISFALLSLIISLYPQTYPNYHHIFTWLNWLDLIEKILTKDLICQKPKVQRVVVQIEFSMTKSTLKWQLILLLTLSIDKNVCKVIKKKKKKKIILNFFFINFLMDSFLGGITFYLILGPKSLSFSLNLIAICNKLSHPLFSFSFSFSSIRFKTLS